MSRVAKRYAKALFELAAEENILNEVNADLMQLKQIINESEGFDLFLSNPLINDSKKLKLLMELFKGKLSETTLRFLKLVGQKRRLNILADIVARFKTMMLEHQNQVEGDLISATELSHDQVRQIQQNAKSLIGKTVLLKQKLEPATIGGFVVKVEDLVIDNSIRYQLNKLREKLIAR